MTKKPLNTKKDFKILFIGALISIPIAILQTIFSLDILNSIKPDHLALQCLVDVYKIPIGIFLFSFTVWGISIAYKDLKQTKEFFLITNRPILKIINIDFSIPVPQQPTLTFNIHIENKGTIPAENIIIGYIHDEIYKQEIPIKMLLQDDPMTCSIQTDLDSNIHEKEIIFLINYHSILDKKYISIAHCKYHNSKLTIISKQFH